jgi:4-amino-4-deoxy-L-arabinose transferase-like glycosyltransferase
MTACDQRAGAPSLAAGDPGKAQAPSAIRLVALPGRAWELLLAPAPGLIAVLLVTFAVYAPAINDWFYADDPLFLRHAQVTSWPAWFAQSIDFRNPKPVVEFNQYRPLYLLAFRAEYSAFGLHAMPYHLTNVLAHLANVALFWFVARRLTGRVWAAHLAAFVFGVHFAYGDAVRWVVNGNTPMATFFYLVAFLTFMKFADGGPRSRWYYVTFLLSFTAALLTHAITVPLAPVIVLWYFLMSRRPADVLRPAAWLPFVPMAAILVPYLVIQNWVHQHYFALSDSYQISWHMYDSYIHYLALSAYPVRFEDSSAVYVSAVMFVVMGFLLSQWRWSPLPLFAVAWYILTIAPDATSRIGDYGRLFYLGGLPLGLIVAVTVMRLGELVEKAGIGSRLAPLRGLVPYAGLAAAVLAVALVWKLQSIAEKSVPVPANTIAKQAEQNRDLIDGLRREIPTFGGSGTLYIARPPFNLVIYNDNPLRSLVQLYYGPIDVKAVAYRVYPYVSDEEIRAMLGPDDRLYVFDESR